MAREVVSVVLEKVQVAVLADRLGDLLSELEKRGVEADGRRWPPRSAIDDTGRSTSRSTRRFGPGSLTLGWDVRRERILRRGAGPTRGWRTDRPR